MYVKFKELFNDEYKKIEGFECKNLAKYYYDYLEFCKRNNIQYNHEISVKAFILVYFHCFITDDLLEDVRRGVK